jgi:glycosyltransferase involved in cell wall biosynthesis
MNNEVLEDARATLGPHGHSVWFDVTDLVHWRGTLTGIQRTQYNLCLQLSKNENSKFFEFKATGEISEVALPNYEVFGDAKHNSPTLLNPSLAPLAFSLLRIVFQRGVRLFPASVRALVKTQKIAAEESLKDILFLLKSSRTSTVHSQPHPFAHGDSVIMLGVTWSITGHQDRVAYLRKELDLFLVSTVYDLIPILRPQFFGEGFGPHYGRHLMDTLWCSDLILSISENTSRDLARFADEIGTPKPRILTFRLGDEPDETTHKPPRRNDIHANEFILSVGTIEVRKNHDILYKVWDAALTSGLPIPKLVLVGRPGWLTHDLLYQIEANKNTKDKIILLNNTDDDELGWLYQNCLFSVYPSWYEGWGLPIAESAKFGKFCLASNTSSMPEIAGELFDYFDPTDSQELLYLVMKYSQDHGALASKVHSLEIEYIPHGWDESAEHLRKNMWKTAE